MTLGFNVVGANSGAINAASDINNANIQTNEGQGSSGTELQQPGTSSDITSEFSIPAEYQDKEWAKGFEGKAGDDLKAEIFKALDDKYSNTPVVPENSEGYSFNDILKDENGELQYEYPDEALNFFGDKFKELGLTKEQGQGILKQYTDFEIEQFEKYTNAEELDQSINTMFGGNAQQRKTVEGLIKEFLPEEDQKFLQNTTPNCTIVMFYKLAKGLVDKYAFKEGTSGGNKTGNLKLSQADFDNEYNRIVGEMEALEKQPFVEPGKKERLQNELSNLFAHNIS